VVGSAGAVCECVSGGGGAEAVKYPGGACAVENAFAGGGGTDERDSELRRGR
jgi:hypothetical protein